MAARSAAKYGCSSVPLCRSGLWTNGPNSLAPLEKTLPRALFGQVSRAGWPNSTRLSLTAITARRIASEWYRHCIEAVPASDQGASTSETVELASNRRRVNGRVNVGLSLCNANVGNQANTLTRRRPGLRRHVHMHGGHRRQTPNFSTKAGPVFADMIILKLLTIVVMRTTLGQALEDGQSSNPSATMPCRRQARVSKTTRSHHWCGHTCGPSGATMPSQQEEQCAAPRVDV